jgi:transcriptional regulator with XRE-family HTH domain
MATYPIKFVDQLRQHLRALRKKQGLTQAQLGAMLGVSQSRIAEIEANPGAVTFDKLVQLLSALGAGISLTDIDEPTDNTHESAAAHRPPAQKQIQHWASYIGTDRDDDQKKLASVRKLLDSQHLDQARSRTHAEPSSIFAYDVLSKKPKEICEAFETYLLTCLDRPASAEAAAALKASNLCKLDRQTLDILDAFAKLQKQQDAERSGILKKCDLDKSDTRASELLEALKNLKERQEAEHPKIFISYKKGSW